MVGLLLMMTMAESSVSFHVKSEDFRVNLEGAGWEMLVPVRPHRVRVCSHGYKWWEKWSFRVQGLGNHDLSQRKDVRDAEHFALTPPWSSALSTSAEPEATCKFSCSWPLLLLTF